METEKILGALAGFAVGIVASLLLFYLVRFISNRLFMKGKPVKPTLFHNRYDERQQLARGKAFEIAFFTMVSYFLLVAVLEELFEFRLLMSAGGLIIGVCLSVFVYITTAIIKDAYISLSENVKTVVLLISMILIMNIVLFFTTMSSMKLIEDGKLTFRAAGLAESLMFLILLVVILAKDYVDKTHHKEDEDNDEDIMEDGGDDDGEERP